MLCKLILALVPVLKDLSIKLGAIAALKEQCVLDLVA